MNTELVAGEGGLPCMVVLGSPRCGTTSLSYYLRDAGLGVGKKDSFYLMDEDAGLRGSTHVSTHGLEGYRNLFVERDQPIVEVTAGYLYQRTALEFFRGWARPPRFVVLVRDPVERLRSVHQYFRGNVGVLPGDMSFEAYVEQVRSGSVDAPDKTVADALSQGKYADHVDQWVEAFGDDVVDIVTFDDMSRNPATVVRRLTNIVSRDPAIDLESYNFQVRNQSYTPRSRLVRAATGLGRRLVVSGRLRAWGGEQLRRWQSEGQSASHYAPMTAVDSMLADYYADSNAALRGRFGIDTSLWA